MQKARKILIVALCIVVTICSCVITADAESLTGFINGTNVRIRKEATTSSEEIIKVSNVPVVINYIKEDGQEVSAGNKVWYNVTYTDGQGIAYTGFAYSEFVTVNPVYEPDADFEEKLKSFPESYHDALRSLHAKYPNWHFVPSVINIDFDTAVDMQYSPSDVSKRKKMVELGYGGNEWRDIRSYNSETDTWSNTYPGWTYASRAAIAYFVDPRTYLDERHIFAFLEQAYNSNLQNKEGLRSVVAGTFLSNGYDNDVDAYLDDIMLASEQSGVSPYVLAAAIILEVGVNGGTVTSGAWEAYDGAYIGYYNFYNWNATGDDVIKNALEYAKVNGWNSREAAIVGGAKLYADGYVAKGQDTYYYKNYNYVNSLSVDHQYAESVYASYGDAARINPAFLNNTNSSATFKIPVFNNMPAEASPMPTVTETPPQPTEPTPTPPPEPVIKKGDTSDDGTINAVDLAAVKMHILGVKSLEGNPFNAGDVNSDGTINAVDLAAIKMHILGVKTIG